MPSRQPERDFQRQVIEIALIYRWRVYFTQRSDHSPAGYPDLTLLRPPELIFAELKAEKGTLSPDQREWVGELTLVEEAIATAAGLPPHRHLFEVNVWRPDDFDSIVKRLSRPYLHPVPEAA